jgi:phosphohistidine phosphatase
MSPQGEESVARDDASRRRLYALRHAKSSWDDPTLADHERPLAHRGEQSVKRLRTYVDRRKIAPDVVLCSSARRTIETLEGIRASLPAGVDVRIDGRLYGAPAERLLRAMRELDDAVHAVMVIAHNPGLEDLANELVGEGDAALRERLWEKFPTGALASMSFDGRWAELGPGSVRLDDFVVPRELA